MQTLILFSFKSNDYHHIPTLDKHCIPSCTSKSSMSQLHLSFRNRPEQSQTEVVFSNFSSTSSLPLFLWEPFLGMPHIMPASLYFNFYLVPVILRCCLPFGVPPSFVTTVALCLSPPSLLSVWIPNTLCTQLSLMYPEAKSSYQRSLVGMIEMCPEQFIIYWWAPLQRCSISFVHTGLRELPFSSSPNKAESLVDVQGDFPMGRQNICYKANKFSKFLLTSCPQRWVCQFDLFLWILHTLEEASRNCSPSKAAFCDSSLLSADPVTFMHCLSIPQFQ